MTMHWPDDRSVPMIAAYRGKADRFGRRAIPSEPWRG
jgi:hypothetical protein